VGVARPREGVDAFTGPPAPTPNPSPQAGGERADRQAAPMSITLGRQLAREGQGRAVADEGNPQREARAGATTWPVDRPRQGWNGLWPQAEFAVPARIREWAAIEVGAGRLLPWFAVAFGTGIVLYFAADHEPAWWAACPLAVVAAISAVLLRRRPIAFVAALGFFAMSAGFAVATLKTALIDHPLLRYPAYMGLPASRRIRQGAGESISLVAWAKLAVARAHSDPARSIIKLPMAVPA